MNSFNNVQRFTYLFGEKYTKLYYNINKISAPTNNKKIENCLHKQTKNRVIFLS